MATQASSSSETTNDGPVLNVINKRLRALRKKLNRISQMEESLSQRKTLNKEQEETFRSKPSVLASIDELEKLRQPLAQAVSQEIQLASEIKGVKPESIAEEARTVAKEEDEKRNAEVPVVSDLLQLIYFGSIFDVRTLMSAHDNMLTRTHERNCCLTYDYVTDDDAVGDPLTEWDMDLISSLGSLLISRPVNSSLSHKNALQKCVEHAKLWLAISEQPIEPNSSITYAVLREKLDKIMASEYFTTTPEIKAPLEVAAAGSTYTSFPVYGSVDATVNQNVPIEGSLAEYQLQENKSPKSHGNEIYKDEPVHVEELQQVQGGSGVEKKSEPSAKTDTEVDQNSRDIDDSKDQQQYLTHRSHQNYRGSRGGGGDGRRSYSNGRGGRGGNRGGGYQNGRGQFSDQQGGYYPRNQNYRGRGGRGGNGGNYSYCEPAEHAGHAQAAS